MGLKIVSTVKEVLEANKEARGDDFILIADVYKKVVPNLAGIPLDFALRNHKRYNLPSFSSIVRARRKLQVEYPELEAEERIKVIRELEEQKYKDFSRE